MNIKSRYCKRVRKPKPKPVPTYYLTKDHVGGVIEFTVGNKTIYYPMFGPTHQAMLRYDSDGTGSTQ